MMKKYQNKTDTIQRRDSVTVSSAIARKIITLLLLPIHQARRRAADASIFVSNHFDTLSILRWILHFCCCSICAHLPPPTPPLSSYITRTRRQSPAASVVVSNPSDASPIPHSLPTPTPLSLGTRDRLPPPMPPSSSSIPWACKNNATSAVRDVHSGASSLLLPPLTPLLLSSIPWSHLPLPTPPSLLPIYQACNRNAAASVVVPESLPPPLLSLIPCCLFLVLRRLLCRRCWLRGPARMTPPKSCSLRRIVLKIFRRRLHRCCRYLEPVFLHQCRRFEASH